MPRATVGGIELEYDIAGADDAPAMLLVMGLGAQMTRWSDRFRFALADRGFRVIRFDNRDVGLSTKIEGGRAPNLVRIGLAVMTGRTPKVPYTLTDMAGDAVGLLDHLRIGRAHVVGASMGGMIAQLIAAGRPERVVSLTSIMSSTGNPRLPRASAAVNKVLTSRPAGGELDALVAHGLRAARTVGSPGYPADEAVIAARIRADLERQNYPQGFARQLAAIWADGDRRKRLAGVTAPTLVIHGTADPLVPVEGGRDTAASIPGARLIEIAGMGHDLPEPLIDRVVAMIADHAHAAGAGG